MSKYIIEIKPEYEANCIMILGTKDSDYFVDTLMVDDLEELNSDYINEHFGDLQDEAYQRGYKDCETRYCSFDACPNRQAEYQRGLDDAWEAAKKIADMWTKIDNDELLAIFGITERIGHSTIRSLFEKQTASEAMLELEAYEEKQKAEDEIKVGDEVETKDGKRFVVTTFGSGVDCEIAVGVCADGLGLYVDLQELRKTGRHFDIASILEDMRND